MKIAAAIAIFLASTPLWAHHSFAAVFDNVKRGAIKGTVTKIDWRNPHMYVYLNVQNPDGSTTNWACETFPPNVLVRQGWKRDAIKEGDTVAITGSLAKNGSPLMFIAEITFPDGTKRLGGAPPAPDGTAPLAAPAPQQ